MKLSLTVIQTMQREQNYFRQLNFAIKINERHRKARYAYITIHLAVKTGQPQIVCNSAIASKIVPKLRCKDRLF